MISLNDIQIRTSLVPGDIGTVIQMHGSMYNDEKHYGVGFEVYVAEGLCEFYRQYDSAKDRVWVAEHNHRITTNELPAAAALYRKFGFEVVEEKPSTGFGKPVIEQKYEWKGA